MTTFSDVIDILQNDPDFHDKIKVTDFKKSPMIKHISKYLNGGISKLKKNEVQEIINAINDYESGDYIFNGVRIVPDVEQQAIIDAPFNANMRVIAGAGTGKTTTILCRVKKLLDVDTTPDRVMILTFNVDAKDNLIKNARAMFGMNLKIDIRTIDSFCGKIRYDFDKGRKGFVSQSENCIIGYEIMRKYGSTIAAQYKYVFFDEFQDVNEEQFGILKCFAQNGCYLTVIGDDCQNIYEFRGTNNYWIINFDTLIENTMTFKITSNYRSGKHIVDLANDVVVQNKAKIHKTMKPHFTNRHGSVVLKVCRKKAYYKYIIQSIKDYINEGIPHHDIAILSRGGKNLKAIETQLEKEKIPYTAVINDKEHDSSKNSVEEGTITVTTIHKAKGLEWHAVFLVGLGDHFFPAHFNNGLSHLEEERRLFYVAVTRPKCNLHFVVNDKELPFSRFLQEVENHIEISNQTNIKEDRFFDFDNNDDKIENYRVVDVLSHLSGKSIKYMKKHGIIPDVSPDTRVIFDTKLDFDEDVKKGRFEPDYSIYCELYMTRKLMMNNEQILTDSNTERVINAVFLTDEERRLFHTYDLRNYFRTGVFKFKVPDQDKVDTQALIVKLEALIKHHNIEEADVEKFLMIHVSPDYYPDWLVDILARSYDNYSDMSQETKQIKRDLYFVSLCSQFNTGRKRLVYRDIYKLFQKSDDTVLPRIDRYVKSIEKYNQISKISVHKVYKIGKDPAMLSGEIDYIDISNKTMVSIKCSNNDFQMEWLVQLLAYYALYCERDGGNVIDVQKLAVINIFDGIYYEFEVPEDYDHKLMIDYLEDVLAATLDSKRDPVNITVDDILHDDDLELPEIDRETMVVEITRPPIIEKYMVLDLENNMGNGDIIQIAYVVCDKLDNIVKRVNHYIANRYVDLMTQDKTGITMDKLKKKGVSFSLMARELLEDLNEVSYIVGHNVHTDISKMISNLHKFHVSPSYNVFDKVKSMDTMKIFKEHTGQKVSVGKMVYNLFEEEMKDAHDAMVDVDYTYRCYVDMKDTIEEENNYNPAEFVTEYSDSIESVMLSLPSKNANKSIKSSLFGGKSSSGRSAKVDKPATKRVTKRAKHSDSNSDEDSTTKSKSKSKAKKKMKPKPKPKSGQKIDDVLRTQKVKKTKGAIRTDLNGMLGMMSRVDRVKPKATKRRVKKAGK
jgi:DNA polymerase III epsilon subunit-like protein